MMTAMVKPATKIKNTIPLTVPPIIGPRFCGPIVVDFGSVVKNSISHGPFSQLKTREAIKKIVFIVKLYDRICSRFNNDFT